KRGEDNGVEGLQLIDAAEIRKREPHIRGLAALYVPSTGIVSAEELVHAYARVATNQGANIVTRAQVVSLEPSANTIRVRLRLGVHFTKTLWGTFLLGPTATYVEGKDNYEKNRLPIAAFAESAKTLLPEIEERDLQLGYTGLRPKLAPPSHKGIIDFVITRDA